MPTNCETYQAILDSWDEYSIILADTYSLATALNTAKASQSPSGAFGTVASTFNTWFDGLWEQYGSGQRMVSQPFSVLLMRIMANNGALGAAVADTPNLPVAAAKCARRGLGVAAFEAALENPAHTAKPLSNAEEDLLSFIDAYRNRLTEYNLIERGSAIAALAQLLPNNVPPMRVCYVSNAPLPLIQQEFFEAASSTFDLVHLTRAGTPFTPGPCEVAQLPVGPALSFAYANGIYAKPQVLHNIMQLAAPEGPVVLAVKDPFATYVSLAHVFESLGLRAAMRARMPLLQTHLGMVYSALHNAAEYDQDQAVLLALVDTLNAPLFKFSSAAIAQAKNKILANRLISVDETIQELAQKSESFALFLSFITNPKTKTLDMLHRQIEQAGGYRPAEKQSMQETLEVLGGFLLAAVDLGVPAIEADAVVYPLLTAASVAVSQANYSSGVGQEPHVLVVSAQQAATLSKDQCATLVVDDLNTESYSASLRDDAVATLLGHVGVEEPDAFINKQRRMFASLVALPTKHLVLGRCLHDADMKELYPAAMLEEFLDTNGITAPKPGTSVTQAGTTPQEGKAEEMPEFPSLFEASEDNLVADVLGCSVSWETHVAAQNPLDENDPVRQYFSGIYQAKPAAPAASAADPTPTEPATPAPDATPTEPATFALGTTPTADPTPAESATPANPSASTFLCESPSVLEVYHECPRKWFVSRWLNLDEPGENFGALERGSFIHECARVFYENLNGAGIEKVTQENFEDARSILQTTLEATRRAQYERDPYAWETRYVALPGSPSEESKYLEIERMLLGTWLQEECNFLAGTGFVPTLFEYPIDSLGAVVGGVQIRGRVDRIDLDEQGNVIIVDYKGSIGSEYATPAASTEENTLFSGKKIQTLLYAAAIRKAGRLVVPEGATENQKRRIEAFNNNPNTAAKVVAGVYFSYNEKLDSGLLRSAGFYCEDSPVSAETLLLGKNGDASKVSQGEEDNFFNAIDQTVAALRTGQQQGNIAFTHPVLDNGSLAPNAKDICKFCPDELCEGRLG